ncbi:YraN family protein [Acidobacteriota bacterium]
MIKKLKPHDLGKKGEKVALQYLKKKKYKILEIRFRLFRGEIDIIASDKNILVFIEVKTRRDRRFGFPEEAVSQSKQQQIKKIAQGFLMSYKDQDKECRFDVISIIFDESKGSSVQHFKNAF